MHVSGPASFFVTKENAQGFFRITLQVHRPQLQKQALVEFNDFLAAGLAFTGYRGQRLLGMIVIVEIFIEVHSQLTDQRRIKDTLGLLEEAVIRQGLRQQILSTQPGPAAPGQVIETKDLGPNGPRIDTGPVGNRLLGQVGAVTNANGSVITGIPESLGDQAGGVGEVVHPGPGIDLPQQFGVAQNRRD